VTSRGNGARSGVHTLGVAAPDALALGISSALLATFPVTVLAERLGVPVGCWLKSFTGVPCPTCGLTTTSKSFLWGDGTLEFPTVVVLLVASVALGVVGLAVKRLVRKEPVRLGQVAPLSMVAIGLALVANWCFQISQIM